MANTTPRNLVGDLMGALDDPGLLLQGGAVLLSLAVAWGVERLARARLQRAGEAGGGEAEALRIGAGGVERLVFPVAAWILLSVARAVLGAPTALLDLAVPLLSSLALVRGVVYALRHAFPSGSWVGRSERAIAWTIWTLMVLHVTGVLPQVRAWMDGIRLPVGSHGLSALDVVDGSLSVAITMVLAVWLGRLAERRLMILQGLDMSLRVVASKLLRAAFIVVGVLVALPLVGIDPTVLSVFGGALGVGLGFGLQKIAANYVSGFVILLDRSIRLGDLVTIDHRYGEVTRLTVRYVVVRSSDGTEHLIPNETVITSTVVNHSYSDRIVRVDGAIQVGYGADVPLALAVIHEVALANPRVLREPEPVAMVKSFGDSGVNLEFCVWIDDPEGGKANLISELNLAVLLAFKARGIEIPFPQREVRVLPPAPEPS